MTVAWTLTRERIADKALEKCRRLAAGQTPSAEDRNVALEYMDAILKSLPLYGYTWPQVSTTQASVTLAAATSPTTLPVDFFKGQNPQLRYVDADGNQVELVPLTLPEWNAIPDKTLAADYPINYYVSPDGKLWTWPVQNQNVTAKMFYQQVVDDSVGGTPPDVDVPWILGLIYGIAAECSDEFGVPDADRQRFIVTWADLRRRGLNVTRSFAPITVEADE